MNRIILYALILMILFLIVKKVGGGARISAKDVYALLQSVKR